MTAGAHAGEQRARCHLVRTAGRRRRAGRRIRTRRPVNGFGRSGRFDGGKRSGFGGTQNFCWEHFPKVADDAVEN